MSGNPKITRDSGCTDFRSRLQDYLDEALPRQESMAVYMHLKECEGCRSDYEDLKALFSMLDGMPEPEVPADFDQKILASVPYAAYREMEPLRRDRVPVILEEESLPGFVRSVATRMVGGAVALASVAGLAAGRLPDAAVAVMLVGILPEALVRLQSFTRRLYVEATQKSTQ